MQSLPGCAVNIYDNTKSTEYILMANKQAIYASHTACAD